VGESKDTLILLLNNPYLPPNQNWLEKLSFATGSRWIRRADSSTLVILKNLSLSRFIIVNANATVKLTIVNILSYILVAVSSWKVSTLHTSNKLTHC
jgi:hypothetical protein